MTDNARFGFEEGAKIVNINHQEQTAVPDLENARCIGKWQTARSRMGSFAV